MTAFDDPERLRHIPLFSELAPDHLAHVNALLHRKTFAAGQSIMAVEHPGEVVYLLSSGAVKIYVEGEEETDVILAILGPGEVVGEMSLIDRLGRSADVVTLEDCTLLWMDRAAFWECLQTMPPMTFALTRILSRRVRMADAHIRSLATLDVYGRVARQLLTFAHEYGQPAADGSVLIPLRLTQNDIAGLVGASRVRVNQVLVAWKRRKYLSVDAHHRITLHNQAPLIQRCR